MKLSQFEVKRNGAVQNDHSRGQLKYILGVGPDTNLPDTGSKKVDGVLVEWSKKEGKEVKSHPFVGVSDLSDGIGAFSGKKFDNDDKSMAFSDSDENGF